MGKVDLKTVGMSCNVADPLQSKLYEHVKNKSNSSWYLKSLVLQDMFGEPVKKEVLEDVEHDLNSFI